MFAMNVAGWNAIHTGESEPGYGSVSHSPYRNAVPTQPPRNTTR